MMRKRQTQKGFTIIELIFATLIFSMVMTVILVSVFQIGRIYYKGVSTSSTSEAARSVIADLSDDVRFSSNVTIIQPFNPGSNTYYFCAGDHRYTFVEFQKVTNDAIDQAAQHPNDITKLTGIRQDTVTKGCQDPSYPGINAQQLLGPDMQINNNDLIACANGACSLHLHIIFYGNDNKVFSSSSVGTNQNDPTDPAYDADKQPDSICTGNLLSSQFCAAIDLQTVVLQRT